ncbi:type VII secretion protein EssA [Staphylococcus edaphicus]|uniref:Type VII secretion protein EssA n=1 Tax=Staphylococcus edaphicus TaxID=1955013 RepID=A0A2C6WK59_9STAP|nr:type VII secretion protein EssA [Staphylococcus edaphicus]PHK48485.1 type VII secretion protein EssA [Staphylococcus edaphicus]UQW81643.1 type VII secretion protein EssA [Staphylococcus edaphicus]
MLVEGLLTLTLLTADNQRGSLDIDVKQEEQENINNDLDQYDTTLFDKDSKAVNDRIKEKKQKKEQDIKNNMFHQQAGQPTRLDETKKILFTPTTASTKGSESDKSPYIQNKQEKNILPYILLSIGAFLTIGFVIFSVRRGRRRQK